PIGDQDFKSIRKGGFLYVDKTSYIEKILERGQYYFLARPRRFGKSLFLSTLKYFFLGERELFKDLYIDNTKWYWEKYPVLHIDLNTSRYESIGLLENVLDRHFLEWENKYDVKVKNSDYSQRFATIIEAAHRKTGLRVVILVDEYDKPLVGNLNKTENFEHYRSQLASIYSNFKSSSEHIRLVFLTGVSRFSKLSVFSDLNNLNDITFDNDFADICGITGLELKNDFHVGIKMLAEEYGIEYEAACGMLKRNYDGYRFAKKGSDIYNPWSLLNAMGKRDIRNYWSITGKPTIIAEALKRVDADLEQVLSTRCAFRTLGGMDLSSPNPVALLYQTGYLTIKEYDRSSDTVTLGVPNNEVRQSLFEELLPYYVKLKHEDVVSVVFKILDAIRFGKPEEMMKNLDIYFAGIPYDLKIEDENNFQNAFYILLTLIGVEVQAEVHTSDGRIDILIENREYIYIIELKYDVDPKEALYQINERQYSRKFSGDHRKIFRIGVNFSSKTRRIEGWQIEC
ncbi:MAG: ATP-binding protein, partial [Muribaculaceae bacterium]|nr:ATP-binding protein [Muribaculaceae bacterium]